LNLVGRIIGIYALICIKYTGRYAFLCGLFNDAVSSSELNDRIQKRSWPILKHYRGLEKVRETTRNLSEDIRSPCRDLKQGPPEYEAGVLTTWLQYLVVCCGYMGYRRRFFIENFSRLIFLIVSLCSCRQDYHQCIFPVCSGVTLCCTHGVQRITLVWYDTLKR
jgi:hypothetical protein